MTSRAPARRDEAADFRRESSPHGKPSVTIDGRRSLSTRRHDFGREPLTDVYRPSRGRGPKYLFDCCSQLIARLRAASSLALFLDFDGTLVRLRHRPEEARLGVSTRRVLRRLAQHPRVTLCFISGRRRADLQRRVRIPGAYYLGLHGWEWRDDFSSPASAHKVLEAARPRIEAVVCGLEGIWVEDKKVSFVVHYRDAPQEAVRQAAAALRELREGRQSQLRVQPGKDIWEVMPRAFKGKGAAVQRLLATLPGPALVVYAGDDVTDESAFRVLRRGITIHVGPSRATQARYFVRSPAEVVSFLKKVSKEIV
jgi:trehalose-phosphatase